MAPKVDFSSMRRYIGVFRDMGKTGNLRKPLAPAIEGAIGTSHITANAKCDEALAKVLEMQRFGKNSKAVGRLNVDGSYTVNFDRGYSATLFQNGEMQVVRGRNITHVPAEPSVPVRFPKATPAPKREWKPLADYHRYLSCGGEVSEPGLQRMAQDVLERGQALKTLKNGNQLYRLETTGGNVLAQVRDGKVISVASPAHRSRGTLGGFNYDNRESRTTVEKIIHNFETGTTRRYGFNRHHCPQGNGWRETATGKPVEFFGDNPYTTYSRYTAYYGPNVENPYEKAISLSVDKNGVVKRASVRNSRGAEMNNHTYIQRDLHDDIVYRDGAKEVALQAVKNETGQIVAFTDGTKQYTPDLVAKMLDVPQEYAKNVFKVHAS